MRGQVLLWFLGIVSVSEFYAVSNTSVLNRGYPTYDRDYTTYNADYPTSDADYPTSDANYQTYDTDYRTYDASYPKNDANYPTYDASYPTKDAYSPTYDGNYPKDDANYPTYDGSYSTKDAYYPTYDGSYQINDANYPTYDGTYPINDANDGYYGREFHGSCGRCVPNTPCRPCVPPPYPQPTYPQPSNPPSYPKPSYPPPTRPASPYCKKNYLVVRKPVTWHNAIQDCRRMGRELVSVHNEWEWDQIKKAIVLSGPPKDYWTSGSRLGYNQYMWTTTWQPFTYTNWAKGEPNNFFGNQHCAYIKAKSFKWDDWDCNGVHAFICEKPGKYC